MNWVKNHKAVAGVGGVIGVAVVAFLAFFVFGIQTKFIDDKVAEDGPIFESGVGADDSSTDGGTDPDAELPPTADGTTADDTPESPETTESAGAPEIMTLVQGQFVDRSHPGSGDVQVLTDGTDQRFVRFTDFETDNGPDLFVYLTTAKADADASAFGADGEFVNLGRLKGNVGDQNYEVPADVDLDRFSTVVVWCDRFSVAFTAADLA